MLIKVEDGGPALALPPMAEAEEFPPQLSPRSNDDSDVDGDETDSDGDGGAAGAAGEPPLKKGPWTPEEDKRLKDYVEAHGEGNWNQVQRNARLNRCGKSCRLRWSNHLRPNLKKGPFDEEEVKLIVSLHLKWGNKWAKMAACMPGRTDNEIKNFWNTRLKRHQRAGLPIYPEYLLSRVPDQDINCHTPDEPRGKEQLYDCSQENVLGMNELLMLPNFDYGKDPVLPVNPLKRRASASCTIPDYKSSLLSVQIPDETEKTFCSSYFNNILIQNQSVLHSVLDGNPSTSGAIQRSMKKELPSFQCSSYDCQAASPIEQQTDTFIQSPESISSQITGLLGKNSGSFQEILNNGDVVMDPTISGSLYELQVSHSYNDVSQLNAYPTSHSSSSAFGEFEHEGVPFGDIQALKSPFNSDAYITHDTGIPDTSLGANYFNESFKLSKDHSFPCSSSSLFDDNSCGEAKQPTLTGHDLDSSAWESMPGACDMLDHPDALTSSSLLGNQGFSQK